MTRAGLVTGGGRLRSMASDGHGPSSNGVLAGRATRGHARWGWLLASGILILGVLIWAQWPSSALWVIGVLVGIQLLFTGWALVMLALAARAWRRASVTAA